MEIKFVTADFSVADQVTGDDLVALKNAGFGTVICNRPDAEAPEQPTAGTLAEQARSLGLNWYWLPITPGQFTEANVSEFKQLLKSSDEPVLAFCRTGTRSITLWALSQAAEVSSEQLLHKATAAGYDLSKLAPTLDERMINNNESKLVR
ncbi:TIGR01244 family sulfur transferase [Oceanisphaera pacifica]|uniref:TIGR01244 family phosphatase n=1 Tax=Oceanisphaera pacifica TaxID=2818389 RepID=A0ABS3NCE9_9GAMM|nr:TIGR01244 family sulfur transferase [Oceanisphaera pacifica]MBO1518278.1 TIGR01244 family phosphatase [Oceanisphaera pacifica]